jgi:hypothetical protein
MSAVKLVYLLKIVVEVLFAEIIVLREKCVDAFVENAHVYPS